MCWGCLFAGCAPLYKLTQDRWTPKLKIQLTLYVLFVGASMAAGGLMPWLLEHFYGWRVNGGTTLQKLYSQELGYTYGSNNIYPFCPKTARVVSYDPFKHGYPAPPLAPQDGKLFDAWYNKPVQLRGVSWFGFNHHQGSVDGLWAGGSSAATDLEAIVYQLKLLGFNTLRLPFTFDVLKRHGENVVTKCSHVNKAEWARRATDPNTNPQPNFASLPDPAVYLHVDTGLKKLCNTYMPSQESTALERLLWTVQYLTASGLYVVLDYHPDPDDITAFDVEQYARSWLFLWATLSCLPHFSSDIRGRLLLDLLNEPDKVGGKGISWARADDVPGLNELYLAVMDSIEYITPGDALFMLQGSALSEPVAQRNGTFVRENTYGLSPGDGFVIDPATITAYSLSDPRPFLDELMLRQYRSRVILAPHLYGPGVSGTLPISAAELHQRYNNSWGHLASEGYCAGSDCIRFPVVAGEMGSQLETSEELYYYDALSQYAQLANTSTQDNATSSGPLVGWVWWAYNANSNGTGGLVTTDWQNFLWPKLRYLVQQFNLNPWYQNPAAFVRGIAVKAEDALQARQAAGAAANAKAVKAAIEGKGAFNTGNPAVILMGKTGSSLGHSQPPSRLGSVLPPSLAPAGNSNSGTDVSTGTTNTAPATSAVDHSSGITISNNMAEAANKNAIPAAAADTLAAGIRQSQQPGRQTGPGLALPTSHVPAVPVSLTSSGNASLAPIPAADAAGTAEPAASIRTSSADSIASLEPTAPPAAAEAVTTQIPNTGQVPAAAAGEPAAAAPADVPVMQLNVPVAAAPAVAPFSGPDNMLDVEQDWLPATSAVKPTVNPAAVHSDESADLQDSLSKTDPPKVPVPPSAL